MEMEAINTYNNGDTPSPNAEKNTGNCPELNPLNLNSMKNIQKLPAEVLAQVFSYLTHTEKLISRLVCTDWNHEISSILAKTSYFALTTLDGNDVILDSEVPWTKIKMPDSPRFLLPTKARSLVTTIVLELSGSDMRESMRILTRFPQLIDLNVIFLGRDLTEREDSVLTYEQLDVLRNQFRENAAKLKILSITFPFGEFSTLSKCLTGFLPEAKCLIQLTFREQTLSDSQLFSFGNSQKTSMTAMLAVSNTISKSSRTLKHLELCFVSKIQKKLFTEVISTLSTLQDLELESFLIHSDPTKRIPASDFQIHQDFLKTQIAKGFLKSLSLPWCSNAALCQEFLQCLPENIKFVGNVCKEHVTDEFYSTLSKCQTMAVHSHSPSMFNQPCPSIRQFHYCVLDFEDFTRDEYSEIYKNLGNSLINVVEFYAVRNKKSSFCGYDLQLIIENFQHLRILEIYSVRCISDDSVCGTQDGCAHELKRTEQLHIHQNVPENMRSGLPLSSLKRLEKLILVGTAVTDVGIYYGLRFGTTLKHMTLETKTKISDWGLHLLVTGNPSLESFDCTFMTGKTSCDGTKNLRKQFPMIEVTGKFKLVETPTKP